eukprot:403361726
MRFQNPQPKLLDGTYDREQVIKNARFLFDFMRDRDNFLQENTLEQVFSKCLYVEDVIFESGMCGVVLVRVKLTPQMKDQNGVVHRSVMNEMLDFVPFRSHQAFDSRYAMTLKLSIEYYNKIPIADELLIECRVYHIGLKSGMLEGIVIDPKTNQRICRSQAVSAYINERPNL